MSNITPHAGPSLVIEAPAALGELGARGCVRFGTGAAVGKKAVEEHQVSGLRVGEVFEELDEDRTVHAVVLGDLVDVHRWTVEELGEEGTREDVHACVIGDGLGGLVLREESARHRVCVVGVWLV